MSKSPQATLVDGEWLTLAETIRDLGKSQSTVERLVGTGALKSKLEARKGRKPERLYSAVDVAALSASQARLNTRSLTVVKAPAETRLAVPGEAISAMRELMAEWRKAPVTVSLNEKLWLNLEEAVLYSGVGVSAILSAAAEQKIIARRIGPRGSIAIKRSSLEAYEG